MPRTPSQKSIDVRRSAPVSVMWWMPWAWIFRMTRALSRLLRSHAHAGATLGDQRDVRGLDRFVFWVRTREADARQHMPKSGAHLEHRERGAQTAAATASERDPCKRRRFLVAEPALGAKGFGVGVLVAPVHERDRGHHGHAGRQP